MFSNRLGSRFPATLGCLTVLFGVWACAPADGGTSAALDADSGGGASAGSSDAGGSPSADAAPGPGADADLDADASAGALDVCFEGTPASLDFGDVGVGVTKTMEIALSNCGASTQVVSQVTLAAGTSSAFSLLDAPDLVEVAPGGLLVVTVAFAPLAWSLDEGGVPVPDIGAVVVALEDGGEAAEVPLAGVAIPHPCPVAIIEVPEGEEVAPGTTLHLDGSQSYAPVGHIAAYQWTVVEQPAGSGAVLQPNSSMATPVFVSAVVGVYRFELDVWDDQGIQSCVPDEATVYVLPCCNDVTVEVIWDMPGTPNPADPSIDAQADLDLHVLHPFAGGWFDDLYDCYWDNPNPSWDGGDGSDVALAADDHLGGPETTTLSPEDGLTYRVGVHYWQDPGHGPSTAQVNIYIYATLVFSASAELSEGDLWDVATIEWPTGDATLVEAEGGGPQILSGDALPSSLGPK